jgi:hypothetical protein
MTIPGRGLRRVGSITLMEHDGSFFDHAHVADLRDTDGAQTLYETGSDRARWDSVWRPASVADHEHDDHSVLDLAHDHGRGPHHHHISVVDNAVGLLYWQPANRPVDVQSTAWIPTPRREWNEWVRDVMENLPPVSPLDSV